MQTVYADVYIEKGKLMAKSSTGDLLTLDHVSGDDFIISTQNVPIKFIRDKDGKVFRISVNGNVGWTKAGDKLPDNKTEKKPLNQNDYLGKYQVTTSGQVLKIDVSLKNGKLWATQLWDGGNSALDYVTGDSFIVNALSLPIKFIRNKDNVVIQLLLNNSDLFSKVEN